MQIDVESIKQRLFSDRDVRARIVREYGFETEPLNANEMATALLTQFEQTPAPLPLDQSLSIHHIFRAAVKALGSNNRRWVTFLKHERRIASLLGNYDPVHTHQAIQEGTLSIEHIKLLLPGQSSSGDAAAILRWAQLLSETKNYYSLIQNLGAVFRELHEQHQGELLTDTDLFLCLVGYLGDPPTRWAGSLRLSPASRQTRPKQHKMPGMGYILASEFLRNLGWNGFKPDRHVQRLFDRWLPDWDERVRVRSGRLSSLIGSRCKQLNSYLTYSLIGHSVAPEGIPMSHVDNLVWLVGVYIEKKGRESDRGYLI